MAANPLPAVTFVCLFVCLPGMKCSSSPRTVRPTVVSRRMVVARSNRMKSNRSRIVVVTTALRFYSTVLRPTLQCAGPVRHSAKPEVPGLMLGERQEQDSFIRLVTFASSDVVACYAVRCSSATTDRNWMNFAMHAERDNVTANPSVCLTNAGIFWRSFDDLLRLVLVFRVPLPL